MSVCRLLQPVRFLVKILLVVCSGSIIFGVFLSYHYLSQARITLCRVTLNFSCTYNGDPCIDAKHMGKMVLKQEVGFDYAH